MVDTFRREPRDITEEQSLKSVNLRVKAQEIHDILGSIESSGKANREIDIAKAKLEECVMWGEKAITA